ncbi:MAG: winged helix-turn-helix domain-containing protein [Nitrosotalea sp.]
MTTEIMIKRHLKKKESCDVFEPSMKTLSRITKVLLEKKYVGKTNLSLETNLHYGRLSRHLDWLEKKHLIEPIIRDNKINLVLTSDGVQFASILSDVI